MVLINFKQFELGKTFDKQVEEKYNVSNGIMYIVYGVPKIVVYYRNLKRAEKLSFFLYNYSRSYRFGTILYHNKIKQLKNLPSTLEHMNIMFYMYSYFTQKPINILFLALSLCCSLFVVSLIRKYFLYNVNCTSQNLIKNNWHNKL